MRRTKTAAWFAEEETTEASYSVFERWVQKHGVPASVYVDRDSIYRCERVATVQEQIAGEEPQTQFGLAMERLGVRLILANSPQAKGRVERRNGLLQDRLVKELRLAGISDLASANGFLEKKFLPALNARFRVEPRSAVECAPEMRSAASGGPVLGRNARGGQRLDGRLERALVPN